MLEKHIWRFTGRRFGNCWRDGAVICLYLRCLRCYMVVPLIRSGPHGGLSEPFVMDRSLREACPSSPVLFIIYHAVVMVDFQARRAKIAEDGLMDAGVFWGVSGGRPVISPQFGVKFFLVYLAMAPKCVQQREDRRVERDEEARRVRALLDRHNERLEGFRCDSQAVCPLLIQSCDAAVALVCSFFTFSSRLPAVYCLYLLTLLTCFCLPSARFVSPLFVSWVWVRFYRRYGIEIDVRDLQAMTEFQICYSVWHCGRFLYFGLLLLRVFSLSLSIFFSVPQS